MEQLLTQYTVEEIILFIIGLAVAMKGIIELWDWGKKRLREHFGKETQAELTIQEISTKLSTLQTSINIIVKNQQDLQNSIDILTNASRDTIRALIVDKYQKAQKEGKIKYYVLESAESLYEDYQKEHGNSFVSNIMEKMRKMEVDSTDKIN